MSLVTPLQKNLRVCKECNATYVINGDPSGYWCEIPSPNPVEGKCGFCKDKSNYRLLRR